MIIPKSSFLFLFLACMHSSLAMDSKEISHTQLFEAARDGEAEIVDAYIQTGESVNVVTDNGLTPIFLAAYNGRKLIVERLLKAEADPNALRKSHPVFAYQYKFISRSPVYAAMDREHWDIVELLILNGADVNERPNSDCFSILMRAAEKGLCKLVELLIAKGAFINTRETEFSISPLRLAAQNGHEEVVKVLIAHKAEINTFDSDGFSPLVIAAQNGHFNIVKLLIAHNAQVNAQDMHSDERPTPLIQAAQGGHTVIVAYLIDHGADVNLCSASLLSPLRQAAQNGHEEVVKLLIAHKAEINTFDSDGFSPLMRAAEKGHFNIVKLLIAHNVQINAQDMHSTEKPSALIQAAQEGHAGIVAYLIDHGANVDLCSTSLSPLGQAAQNGHFNIVKLLIAHNAQINAQDTHSTEKPLALIQAAQKGRADIVAYLIDHGANVDLCSASFSPLRLAAQNGHEEVVKLLIAHKAEINTFDSDGFSPLAIAAENGHFNVVKLLIAHNAQVNAQDIRSTGKVTALIQAAQGGHADIVAYLIDHGADVNLCSVFGPALYFVAQKNHMKAAETLLKAKARLDIICPKTGWTPLLAAAGFGYTEMVKLLFAWGAKNDQQMHFALAIAASNNRSQTCKYLIRQGADIYSIISAPNIIEQSILDFAETPETRDAMLTESNKCSLTLSHLCVKAIAKNDQTYVIKDEDGTTKEVGQRGALEYLREKGRLLNFLDDCSICAKEDRVIMLTPCCYASICISCWENATTPQGHTHDLILDQQGPNRLIYRQEVTIGGKCPFCNKAVSNKQ